MNKKIVSSLVAAVAIASMFVGCGGGSSSSSTDAIVEDGPILGATVCDSSVPQICATQKDTKKNVYTFSSAPTYPIAAKAGYIDLDGDGKYSTGDKVINELKSFSTNITPLSSLVVAKAGGVVVNKGEAEVKVLAEIGDTTLTVKDLAKLPSKMQNSSLIKATYDVVVKTFKGNDISDVYVDNANISIVIGDDNANSSKAVESDLYADGTIPADTNSDFLVSKYKVPVWTNKAVDKVAIYNNISADGWETLATDTYSDYKIYRSETALNCQTNFNGTICTEQDNGQETLMTNILFTYNANVSDDTNSNVSDDTNSNVSDDTNSN